jgi:hypothetical protein
MCEMKTGNPEERPHRWPPASNAVAYSQTNAAGKLDISDYAISFPCSAALNPGAIANASERSVRDSDRWLRISVARSEDA